MAIEVAHDDEGFGQLISKIIKLPQGQCLSGGMYTEQIVTALCSVTLTAVACNWVINGMGRCNVLFLTRMELPPEAIILSECILLYAL